MEAGALEVAPRYNSLFTRFILILLLNSGEKKNINVWWERGRKGLTIFFYLVHIAWASSWGVNKAAY